MVLAVPPERLDELLAVFAAEDVEAVDIGRFTGSGQLVLHDRERTVGQLDMQFLHDGTPRPLRRARLQAPAAPDPGVPACADPVATLCALLAMPAVASKEWIT